MQTRTKFTDLELKLSMDGEKCKKQRWTKRLAVFAAAGSVVCCLGFMGLVFLSEWIGDCYQREAGQQAVSAYWYEVAYFWNSSDTDVLSKLYGNLFSAQNYQKMVLYGPKLLAAEKLESPADYYSVPRMRYLFALYITGRLGYFEMLYDELLDRYEEDVGQKRIEGEAIYTFLFPLNILARRESTEDDFARWAIETCERIRAVCDDKLTLFALYKNEYEIYLKLGEGYKALESKMKADELADEIFPGLFEEDDHVDV